MKFWENHNIWLSNPRIPDHEFIGPKIFNSLYERYPMYMYLGASDQPESEMEARGSEGCIIVENEEQEADARRRGYDNFHAGMLSNKVLINWFWDLEDFSPKQLVVFAKEEFDIDLPVDASQLCLFSAVLRLSRCAPQNSNRIILMAHTIEMNYDETLSTIRKQVGQAKTEFVQEFMA